MSEKCYSTDEENFSYCDLSEAVERQWDDLECETAADAIGQIVIVYEGDTKPHDPMRWIPDMEEYMAERAYDDAGEHADDWPGADKDQRAELQAEVKKVVSAWLDKYNLQPAFWQVINVRKVRCRITSETGEYEVLEQDGAPNLPETLSDE